ncbi:serine acetyltransferase [Candidatus Marinamargulisbacteria bacterium SCGC AG-343-D04]|nr:serine acetyltransferase [Candidatus Marinamargulisbacteria bacterium SCGC AG-343-D04]
MIDSLIKKIIDSYSQVGIINPVDGIHYPPMQHLELILEQIKEVLFPGFFGIEALEHKELKKLTKDRVTRLHTDLLKEILKCVLWNPQEESPKYSESEAKTISEDVVISFLTHIPFLREALIDDAVAMYKGDPAASSMIEVLLSYPGFQAVMAYRIAHFFHSHNVPIIPRMITEIVHFQTGIDIHPGAQIGRHFCIDHGTGIVIGETTIIGDHVKLYQGVTLGAFSVSDGDNSVKRHPTLEDHVTIYAMSTILGGNTVVGSHSVVGGNVWLTRSLSSYSKIYLSEDFDTTYKLVRSKKD